MNKILAIADIHLFDYPNRNPLEKYRLLQNRIVCQNIIEAGKNEGANILVIAGDLIEKFLIRPYIQSEVKLFLDTLMSNFEVGYIIWGNHDQENKSINSEFSDSCLAVMLPPNLHYADMKEIVIDGCRIGFSNWRPEFDLSWINGKLDFLFTHATISYSDDDQIHSQVLDESKFDLAICGDIHRPANKGKYVSIGVPQRCKMSDSDICSGVIVDCASKQYKWVNLNPHDNLMKFEYTNQQDEEGWNQNLGTWKVYRPSNQTIKGGVQNIEVPAWEEIGNLVNSIIEQNGLQAVHSEVLSNIKDLDSKEVDFNFDITRFYCKNWRSIDEVELFFSNMDKVLITGHNGSGKSSLLSAIKYAFLENPHPKDLIQFGTKECWAEVEFTFQGSSYKIQRGSKKYGFWINGEQQKYNNKRSFEEDMHVRFPFIDYMDCYFFDADHSKLIGDITPERKSEIISRFYKMDRIDAYNEQAKILLDNYIRNGGSWKEEKEKAEKLLSYISGKLAMIVLPSMCVNDLLKKKEVGLQMQEAWKTYNSYKTKTANLQAMVHTKTETLEKLKNEVHRDPEVIKEEGDRAKSGLSFLGQLNSKLLQIKTEGRKLYTDRQNLDKKKTCSLCGHELKVENLEQHKMELDKRIQELMLCQEEVYKEFEKNFGISDKQAINSGCQELQSQFNQVISSCMYELNMIERNIREIQQCERDLATYQDNLANIGPVPQAIELPQGFMEQMGQIEADLTTWKQFEELERDKANAESVIAKCKDELEKMSKVVGAYQAYIKLTGPTGSIYKEIMENLARQFSDNRVSYFVVQTEGKGNRKDHLNLESSYKLGGGNEVRYVNCSAGQRTLLDVDLLSKVVTRMGLLIMDEFLKHLDAKNHDIILDIIGQMNIGLTMISSHMESIPAFNNKSILLELNESGVTKIKMK